MSSAVAPHPRQVARWEAIGCLVHVETVEPGDLRPARDLVATVLSDVDEVASRFRDESDLSRVNRRPGHWVEVDPLLVDAVRVALRAAEDTGGLVHPLLGRPLVALGYDRTFRELAAEPVDAPFPAPAPVPLDAWRGIDLDDDRIRIPADTALDLGATAKAWCADLAAVALEEQACGPALVSIGGDLRTVGPAAWSVDVSEHPDAPAEQVVEVTGALATSSTRVRRWTRDGVVVHHLLDPRTGRPAGRRWRTATALAPTCVAANTASTAAIVLGDDAETWLAEHHLPAARLVGHDGVVRAVGAWPAVPAGSGPHRPDPTPTGDLR